MKENPGKFNLILSDCDTKTIITGNFAIKSFKNGEILGVAFDNKTNF